MTAISPARRREAFMPLLGGAVALILAGCATTAPGALAPTPLAATSPSESPSSPTPTPGREATPDPAVEASSPSTAALLDACLEIVATNDAAAQQLSRSTVLRSEARSALRPDDLLYVVVPISDPTVDLRVEYACLLTSDLALDSTWARVAPEVDDFDQWATATEPEQGP